MVEKTDAIRMLLAGLSLNFCSSLTSLARRLPDVAWVTSVPTLEIAIEASGERPPDVLLVEFPLHGNHQHDLVRDMLARSPHPGLVAVSMFASDEGLFQAISLGSAAFVEYDTPPEFVISIIRRVYSGERPIEYTIVRDGSLTSRALSGARHPFLRDRHPDIDCPLSVHELGILTYVSLGRANKEIAGRLCVKEQTVKNHMSVILRKINASDRAHAVTMALRNRWITLS